MQWYDLEMDVAYSIESVPIRLTYERWFHIVENHDELAGQYDNVLATLEDPEWVLRGYGGSLIAVRGAGKRRYLMVVYKQLSKKDGFVITAYFSSKLNKKEILWRR